MNKIKINTTFKKLIPPLSKEEFEQLEQNILAERKIRDPLVLWNGTLVDGHNRYQLAQKHSLDYKTENIDFPDEETAIVWIINNQLGRRNLPPYVRAELASMKEPIIKAEAEKRMLAGKADPTQKSSEGSGETRNIVASLAGVSHDTYRKDIYIQENAEDDVIQSLREGKTSINAVYKELKRKPETAEDRAEYRKIAEQVKRSAEYARNHKRTIQEFHDVLAANAESFIYSLKSQIDFMDAGIWADRKNIETAFAAIDEIITNISKMKEELNAKFEAQQSNNPANDPGGIREGPQKDNHSQ